MDYQMVCLDMDGTTLDHDVRVSKENIDAMKKAADQGVHVVPATGRCYGIIPKDVRDIEGIRYAITSNGAAVYDIKQGRNLTENPLTDDEMEAVKESMEGLDMFVELYVDNQSHAKKESLVRIGEYVEERYIPTFLQMVVPVDEDRFDQLLDSGRMEKLNIFFKSPEDRAEMARRLEERGVSFLVAAEGGVEIFHKGNSKGKALRELCEILNLPLERVVAVGDSGNDVEMVKEAGLGVAVENAIDAVKEAASHVTVSNNESAAAKVIKEFIL